MPHHDDDSLRERGPRPDYLRDENPRQGFSAPSEWLRGAGAEARGHYGRGPRGYRRSDDRIREAICDRLTVHDAVDASDMEVHVRDGIVTLSGSVDDRQQKRLAEWIAEDEPGVDDVDNRLEIRHGFWSSAGSELVVRDRQLLGGLTPGPGGEPTIDIHAVGRRGPASTKRGAQDKRKRPSR